MATTNITGSGSQTKLFEGWQCSPVWVGELKQQSITFSAVNILLSITAILGNSLIVVALRKESSLHPPSKLLYRCLATTDLLVGLVNHPFYATYWMSVVYEHWSLCRCALGAMSITGSILSFFVYNGSHKRGPTSCHVAEVEIQRDCNFKAHIYYFSDRLGSMSSGQFIISSQVPYWPLVQLYSYTILPGNLYRLVHKDFSRAQSSSSSNTRSCSTTTEPTKCAEHGAIQKGIVQCTVGAISFSRLLCTTFYGGICDPS